MVASCTPCDRSATSSLEGQRVAAMRRRKPSISSFGISTSNATLDNAFPGRAEPTIHYFAVGPGVDPEDTATRLESVFLENGLEAQSIQEVVD